MAVHYYLSRDGLISFGDVLLGESTVTLNRGNVMTTHKHLVVPNTTAAGDYFIIAVVDPWNAIAEAFEDNNMTDSRRFVVN